MQKIDSIATAYFIIIYINHNLLNIVANYKNFYFYKINTKNSMGNKVL